MKFFVNDPGDRSVGIWPYSAIVEVTVRDHTVKSRGQTRNLTGDEITALKESLKEAFTDGGICLTMAEYKEHLKQEAKLEKELEKMEQEAMKAAL